MKSLLERKRSNWLFAIVTTLIFLTVMGVVNVFSVGNRLTKLSLKEDETTKAYRIFNDYDKKTQSANVEFLAFFMDSGNRTSGTKASIKNGTNLYISLNVMNEGYLKNGRVSISSNNFTWDTNISSSNAFVDTYYRGVVNTINLADKVSSGNQSIFTGRVYKNSYSNDVNSYNGTGSVTFSGIYVDNAGNETPINKTIDLNVDWTGDVESKIQQGTQKISPNITKDSIDFNFYISNSETKKQLILDENIVTAELPLINGNAPTSVTVNNRNASYTYNSSTRILTITNSATLNSSGKVIRELSDINNYYVTVSYAGSALNSSTTGTIDVILPITGKYTAYSGSGNVNSNVAKGSVRLYYNADAKNTDVIGVVTAPSGGGSSGGSSGSGIGGGSGSSGGSSGDSSESTVVKIPHSFTMSMGTTAHGNKNVVSKAPSRAAYSFDMSKENTYEVKWKLETGNINTIDYIKMVEPEDNYGDKFKTNDDTEYSMADFVSTTGIEINYGAHSAIEKYGYIKVYDADTGEVLCKITSSDSKTEYSFGRNVKHIKVVAKYLKANSTISITSIKKIDSRKMVKTIGEEAFDNISYIYSYMEGEADFTGDNKEIKRYATSASFEDEESQVKLSLNKRSLTLSKDPIDEEFSIYTSTTTYNQIGWKNGIFLIECPESISYLDVKDVTVTDKNVKISGYETYKENNKYFIKVFTSNTVESTYFLNIATKLMLDPTNTATSGKFSLYAYNENCYRYYESQINDQYDINGNNNKLEKVGYSSASFDLVSSEGVTTLQTATNYDTTGEISIAPNVADVNKNQQSADINLLISNNYSSSLYGTMILGNIPYENNKHIINNEDLNSNFSTTMTAEGIQVPDALKKYVTVYYSENGDATKELDNKDNNWTQTPSDFSKVKKFLIDFGNYTIPKKCAYTFKYTVNLPQGLDYNKTAYSAFATYYSISKEGGMISEYSEPSKLGIAIVRNYALDLTKFNFENNKRVSSAIYKLSEKNGDEVSDKYLSTNAEGKITSSKLYVNREYTLVETSPANGYCLNDDEIKFMVTEGENDELNLQILTDDNFRTDAKIENNTLIGELEDEPRFKLNVTVRDSATNEFVAHVPFSINNKYFYGNEAGVSSYSYLDKNMEYTLKEEDPYGYYAMSDVNFTINYEEKGKYSITSDNDAFKNAEFVINENDDAININVELTNERKPSVLLHKIDKKTGSALANVSFVTNDGSYYMTDSEGNITIEDIDEGQEIILKELTSPGYYLETVKFTISRDSNNKLIINSKNADFAAATVVDETRRILKVDFNNTPIVKYNLNIEKIEKGNPGKKLANAEFTLYSEDTDESTIYKTNEQGIITVPDLYAFVDGRNYTGKYTLREITAPDGYANDAEEISFTINQKADESLEVNIINADSIETVKETDINENEVKFVIEDRPLFRLIKKDSETGELLANAEFVIYELDADGKVVDFAKDINNNYVGSQDKNGNYIVKTNENGTISLPLKDGTYMIVEIGFPEGYLENDVVEYFKVGNSSGSDSGEDKPTEPDQPSTPEETNIIEINNIEDLVDVQKAVSNGETYEGKTLKLMRTLDFNDVDSYRDATSVEYGNINDDSSTDDIKTELTKEGATGFMPIGTESAPFKGNFDGNNNEIRNIYINFYKGESYSHYQLRDIGLFGYASGSEFKNLTVSGKISGVFSNTNRSSKGYKTYDYYVEKNVGGVIGYLNQGSIDGVNNKINLDLNLQPNNTSTYGWYVKINAGGIVGNLIGNISNSSNEGSVGLSGKNTAVSKAYDGTYTLSNINHIGGIVGNGSNGKYVNLINKGEILLNVDVESTTNASEINYVAGIVGWSSGVSIDSATNEAKVNVNNQSELTHKSTYTQSSTCSTVMSAGNYIGGIAGYTVEISNSANKAEIIANISNTPLYSSSKGTANLSANNYVGGISAQCTKVLDSYNIGNVKGTITNIKEDVTRTQYTIEGNNKVAGIVAENATIVFKSYNKGHIETGSSNMIASATNAAGITTSSSSDGVVQYAYNIGNIVVNTNAIISSTNNIGGISSIATVKNAYNVGSISNTDETVASGIESHIDGVSATGNVEDAYYLEGIALSAGTVAKDTPDSSKTSEYMKSQDFIDDLKDCFYADSENVNDGYPILGESKVEKITTINYVEDLVELVKQVNSGVDYKGIEVSLAKSLDFQDTASYRDASSIELGDVNGDGTVLTILQELTVSTGFIPIGNDQNPFTGVFNGNGYEINNLYISNSLSKLGLFGYVKGGSVKNLTVSGSITDRNTANAVGGIISYIEDGEEISNCVNNVTISSGSSYMGGIVGEVISCKKISECTNNVNFGCSGMLGG